jgi:predicted DNA-binding transcriptional regulator AlpA
MPHTTINSPEDLPVSKVTLDKAQVDAIANAVATRLERASGKTQPKLVSIKDAGTILGVGRSSVNRMMEDGRLESRQIGSRSLIQMASIEAILEGSLE